MLADLLIKSAEQFEQEESHFSYRPSLLGPERCERQMVYWGLKVPRKPLPGRAIILFEDSNWHEELTIDRLRKTAYRVHSEQMHVNIETPLHWLEPRMCMAMVNGKPCGLMVPPGRMAGHLDAILQDMMRNDYLLEHKALNHFTFQRLWGGEIPWDYLSQAASYLSGLSLLGQMEKAILLVKNKNTSAFLEYHVGYDTKQDILTVTKRVNSIGDEIDMDVTELDFLKKCYDKFQRVHEAIETKHLPKRDYKWDTWHCEYCHWCMTCWEGYEKEFAEQMKTTDYLPDEFADMVRYWKECQARRLSDEKEEDKIKETIIEQMKTAGYKSGLSGGYILELELKATTRYKTEMLPEAVRETIKVQTFSERLKSRKAKIAAAAKDKEESNGKEVYSF